MPLRDLRILKYSLSNDYHYQDDRIRVMEHKEKDQTKKRRSEVVVD